MKQFNLNKKINWNKYSPSYLILLFIFLSVLFFSCKKDTDTKNSSMDDTTRKRQTTDSVHKKMDNNMDNMMHKKMSDMMAKMKAMKMSGNTDVDFVNMMIMHHQGAIEMATSEVASGKDANMKSMANNIIQDQKREIATMQSWLGKNKDKKSSTGDHSKKLMESMDDMMDPDMKMTGDTDIDFVKMMIMHHEGAIDMAKVEVDNGADPEIKKMAEEIIKKQEDEIDQMEEWQSKNK